ncbi:MAG: hypothetical protein NZU63_15130 [Gemmataceae bacterium]|nr:hypothetical protein [Gemmataceae bacterium]MDW8244929.1 hypothetical protein [Thermogemmata sp.]
MLWIKVRAQRLSASLHSTHANASTTAVSARVINAFRHHCIQHGWAAPSSAPSASCAQRLSASLHSTLRDIVDESGGIYRAQRLSASLHSTHFSWIHCW